MTNLKHDVELLKIREDAKDLKKTGWLNEAGGQLVKVAGKIAGNDDVIEEGAERQSLGNVQKHVGKLIEDQTNI